MTKKTKKLGIVGLGLGFAICGTVIAANANIMSSLGLRTVADNVSYGVLLTSSNKVTASEVTAGAFVRKTGLGNDKNFALQDASVAASGFVVLAQNGFVRNENALNSITAIEVTTSASAASSYRLYYGSAKDDCEFFMEGGNAAAVSGEKKVFTLDFAANYFVIVNVGEDEVTIDEVKTTFLCEEAAEVATEFCVAMQNQYFQYDKIAVPAAAMRLGSEKVVATGTVYDPDGIEVTGETKDLQKAGTYTIKYAGTYGNSKFEKSVAFDAVENVAFVSSNYADAVKSITVGQADGVVYDLRPGDTLYFNQKADVSSASFAGSYTFITVGSNSISNSTYKIIMRDVVDPTNYIEVIYATYVGNSKASFWVRASNQSRINGCEANFMNKTNLLYDNASKKIGVGGKSAADSVYDLTDTTVYDAAWGGFTNGQIYMTVECMESDETVTHCFADYVQDNRNYVVTGKPVAPSSREGNVFHLRKDSTYKLDGYSANLATSCATYFFLSPKFDATYINATIVFKVIDVNDATNFFYIVLETLSNANIRISVSDDGKPDLTGLISSNSYAILDGQINITLDTPNNHVSNWNNASGNADISGIFDNKATAVKVEMTADCDINFTLEYFGDTKTWY